MRAFGYRVMWDLLRGGNGTKRRFTVREARDVPLLLAENGYMLGNPRPNPKLIDYENRSSIASGFGDTPCAGICGAKGNSATWDHVCMTHEQPPRASFIFPDVREAALDQLAGHKTGTGCVSEWLHGFEAHDDDKRSISTDKFNLALEP
jgi:hypothetical protein